MKKEELSNYPVMTQAELEEALKTAILQTRFSMSRFGGAFKHIFSTGNFYTEAPNNQWTNGFWTGQLWLAYECTKDEDIKRTALAHADDFRHRIENQIETDTHDLGFLYTPSCVAAYKLTGDEKAKETALMAAQKLLERFHEKGQFLQAWGKLYEPGNYRLIIDCLLNLPLLYWAGEVTGNEVYAKKAEAHVQTALKVLIRPDCSTYHTFYFDPETGAPLKGVTHQGYSADSAWSRGQAWGIYGIALSYCYTKNPEYVELFEKVTGYFLEHLPGNLVPYWDFIFKDGSMEPRDSSAAAIAACGMLEMAKYLPEEKALYYTGVARRLMKALYDTCAARSETVSDGLLLHGVYGRKTPYNDCIDHGVDECNLWGDYYYLEGLVRLNAVWNPYW
ncbi:glycoside hydrolase family 88 protein [Lacrimispora brassicae]